jgi:hypothetical protein
MTHRELGARILERLEKDLVDVGEVEARPRMEGNQMFIILGPKRHKTSAKTDQTAKQTAAAKPAATPKLGPAAKTEPVVQSEPPAGTAPPAKSEPIAKSESAPEPTAVRGTE